jgi:hypothetical protein
MAAWRGLARLTAAAALAAAVTACAPLRDAPPPTTAPSGPEELRLSFDDMLAPSIFDLTGPAMADPEAAGGLWAVVPGLSRPERARILRLDGGASVTVALFRGPTARDGAVRISAAAAEALGMGEEPAQVRITALRREPRLAAETPRPPAF